MRRRRPTSRCCGSTTPRTRTASTRLSRRSRTRRPSVARPSDGLTYTFHLRSEAKWADGKPVVAADWVYGWKHFLNPALAAGYVDPFFDQTIAGGSGYSDVDVKSAPAIDSYLNGLGLSAPDDHTFVVKLAQPAGYFKWVASLWMAVPLRKDIVEQAAGGAFPSTDTTKAEAWANDPRTIVGNGMFKIAEYTPKDHLTLAPNTYFWGGPPKLQKLTYSFIADGNTAFANYRTGQLDALLVPVADVITVRQDPQLSKQARLYPRLGTTWVAYNSKRAPLDNADVRLALSKAIDRDKLTKDVLKGTATPIQSFIPKGMNGYDPSLGDAQKFDPAAAKQLLQKAGVTAADLSKFKLLTRDLTGNKTVNQFISQQWQDNLGVNIAVDVVDSKTVTSDVRKGQFDIYGPDGWIADYPDQQDWFDIFTSTACHSLNWGCVSLPGYDRTVAQADGGKTDPARNAVYQKAQKQVIDAGTVGFLYQSAEYTLIRPYVRGLTVTPMDDQGIPGDLQYHDAFIAKH
ncbi:MAG: peptide ABC transporter substrate-binding protein [Chloroflexi bacterium]|nr:MAG: peptide ABC transporter substrate-binding protein [Chloroflexota bacterium]